MNYIGLGRSKEEYGVDFVCGTPLFCTYSTVFLVFSS